MRTKVAAIVLCTPALVFAGASRPQQPPERPQVKPQEKSERARQPEGVASGAKPAANAASASPVTPVDKLPAKPQGEHGSEEGSEFWPAAFGYRLKITDSLLVLFTFFLWRVTAGLRNSTDKLWEEAKAAGTIAESTASAAKASADALMAAERAYVFAEIQALHVPLLIGTAESLGTVSAIAKLWNYGKTPAVITRVRGYVDIRPIIEIPHTLTSFQGSDNKLPPSLAIAPNTCYEVPLSRTLNKDELMDIRQVGVKVFFVGELLYETVLGKVASLAIVGTWCQEIPAWKSTQPARAL